jgi:hypothetical protein
MPAILRITTRQIFCDLEILVVDINYNFFAERLKLEQN